MVLKETRSFKRDMSNSYKSSIVDLNLKYIIDEFFFKGTNLKLEKVKKMKGLL